MFTPQFVSVLSLGEDVRLSIGTWQRLLHFETALLLAAWMDECARAAKQWSGAKRRLLRGVGTLHDASDPHWLDAGQPFDPLRVYPVNRDLLKKEQISARQNGGAVMVRFGETEAEMPWEAALQIAQFIRLKAKESQTRAGDTTRHWGEIVGEHVAQHGPGVTRG